VHGEVSNTRGASNLNISRERVTSHVRVGHRNDAHLLELRLEVSRQHPSHHLEYISSIHILLSSGSFINIYIDRASSCKRTISWWRSSQF
jgi:hypothetical protein